MTEPGEITAGPFAVGAVSVGDMLREPKSGAVFKVTRPAADDRREVRVVSWIDSALQNVQVGRTDYPKPELIRSVGFVVEETDEYITLARDDMKDDEFRGLLCIPRECVRDQFEARATPLSTSETFKAARWYPADLLVEKSADPEASGA